MYEAVSWFHFYHTTP